MTLPSLSSWSLCLNLAINDQVFALTITDLIYVMVREILANCFCIGPIQLCQSCCLATNWNDFVQSCKFA